MAKFHVCAVCLLSLLVAVPCAATGVNVTLPAPDLGSEGLAQALRRHLLSNYSYQSPAPGAVARVQLFLSQLVAVDTAKQTFSIQGWWRLSWQDPRLVWNPDVWGITSLVFEESEIWRPDEFIYETISEVQLRDSSAAPVVVSSDGFVGISTPRVSTIGCRMDLNSFPFDEQTCTFTLGSMGYSKAYLDLLPKTIENPATWWADETQAEGYDKSAVDLSDFTPHSEFSITKITVTSREQIYACCPDPYPVLIYAFHLRRMPWTYFSGTMLPLMIVTMVSHCGFLLGASSLGRVGLGITAMLTTSSIYTVASTQIPKTGEFTILGTMYLVCLISGLVVIVEAIIVTSLIVVQPQDPLSELFLRDKFRRHDHNHSGSLDLADTRRLLKDIGLPSKEIPKAISRLTFDDDGNLSLGEWLRVCDFLIFDHHAHRAQARYHNGVTSTLIQWGLQRDRDEVHKREWEKATVKRDLGHLVTERHAGKAWSMMTELHIAANYEELAHTRRLLSHKKGSLERTKLEDKIRHIARVLIAGDEAWGGGNTSTRIRPDPQDVEVMERCLLKVLRGLQYKADPMWIPLSLPPQPLIESMHEWTVDEVRDFLNNVSGDLANKAKFARYASFLERNEITGACLNSSSYEWVRDCGVPMGDQEALNRGLRVLARLHQASIEYLHLLRVTVEAATHLPKVDQHGLCDPYVLFKLDNDVRGSTQEFCTTYKPKELDPTWKHQTFDVYVADLDHPGECVLRVMDHNVILQDRSVGCYLFGEVYAAVPKYAGPDDTEQPLYLGHILRKACSGVQRVRIPLSLDGKPLIGEDSQRACVTLSFEVMNGGRKDIKLMIPGNQYPRSCLEETARVNLVAKQYLNPDGAHQGDAEGAADPDSPTDEASFEELRDTEDGLPVKDWNHDVQRDSALVVNEDYTNNAVVRVGRQLAAEIDSWFFTLLPSAFCGYLVYVFGSLEMRKPGTFVDMIAAKSRTSTRIGFYDNRTDGPAKCFMNSMDHTDLAPAIGCERLESDAQDMPEGWSSTAIISILFISIIGG